MLGQATASQLQEHHGSGETPVTPLDHESPKHLSPEYDDGDAASEPAPSETAQTEVHGEPTPKQEPFDICACNMLRMINLGYQ